MADENDNTRWQLGDTVHIPLADDDTPQAPPLDDDLLPSIKYRYETHYKGNEDMPVMLESDLPWLIAKVDRLRAREAAAMAIVREVADVDMYYTEQPDQWNCPFCDGDLPVSEMTFNPDEARKRFKHAPDCPVTKARARLAQE